MAALDLNKLAQMKAADTSRQTSFVPKRAVTAQPVKPVARVPMAKKAVLPTKGVSPVAGMGNLVAAPAQGGNNPFVSLPKPTQPAAYVDRLSQFSPESLLQPILPSVAAPYTQPLDPRLISKNLTPQVNPTDVSLWDKAKGFFGFGDSKTPATTGSTFDFSPMEGLKDVFKGANTWAKEAGMFDSTKDGITTQGWAAPVMGGIKGIADSYMAMEMYGLYKDSLENSKQQFAQNFGAQAKAVNSRLADRQAARVANNPNAHASVNDYMAKWGV